MKKTITVVTATRAEYGLLKTVIKRIQETQDLDVKVVATGAHLSPEFGMTYHEIEQDGIQIDRKIEILMSSDSPEGISKSMGMAMIEFGSYFQNNPTDALLVLGDRYEMLAVCCAAMNARIPIFHMHGGEITQGAVDEAIRHSITKMSYLHFTSTETYRKRVIQLGESPDRVYAVGAVGVENAMNAELFTKQELERELNCSLSDKYAVVTFHPVTLENQSAAEQIDALLSVIDSYPDFIFIFTKANADSDGRIINSRIEEFAKTHGNTHLYSSLGMKRYLSAVKYSSAVIGNSSSGILEVPSFGVPTVNIGDRQKGRIQAESIINCAPEPEQIKQAIDKAFSPEFRRIASKVKNPYGNGNTSKKIVDIMREWLLNDKVSIKKEFYDIV